MAFISDSRKPQGPGILVLQDHDKQWQGNPDMRSCLLATRVLGRPRGGENIGHFELDGDTPGDLGGGLCWPKATRPTPGWEFAWPTVLGGVKNPPRNPVSSFDSREPVATGGGVSPDAMGMGACADAPDWVAKALPIFDHKFSPDKRYAAFRPYSPRDQNPDLWPKYHAKTYGITLTATDELKQLELFFPTDPRLIAVNAGGDPAMASLVCDLDGNFEVDPDRTSRLHSTFRVIRHPLGGANIVGFQLNISGCADTSGGYFIDKVKPAAGGHIATGGGLGPDVPSVDPVAPGGPGGGGGDPGSFIAARGSQAFKGPFEVGAFKDKHRLGLDADGNVINSLHWSTNTLFWRNAREDGPLFFEQDFPGAQHGPKSMHVHLEWDKVQEFWRWRAETLIYVPEKERNTVPTIDGGGGGGGGGRDGGRNGGVIDGGGGRTGEGTRGGTGGGGPILGPDIPSVDRVTGGGVSLTDGTGIRGGTGPGGLPVATSGGTSVGQPSGDPLGGSLPSLEEFLKHRLTDPAPILHESGPSSQNLDIATIAMETAMPSILIRPQNYGGDGITEIAINPVKPTYLPVESVKNTVGMTDGALRKIDQSTPITIKLEGYGAQGGKSVVSYPDGLPSTNTGNEYDPWRYTTRPGTSKYGGGTASGGIVMLPPEVGMEDYKDQFQPNGVTRSSVFFVAGPGAQFASGLPNKATGGIAAGVSWGPDPANAARLLFTAYPYIVPPPNPLSRAILRMDQSGLGFAGDSTGTNWGTLFATTLTGAQTYRLPDASGTVALTSVLSGMFTIGSVIFAGFDGLLTQDNANLFWDDTNNRLGIGINSGLSSSVHVSDSTTSTRPQIILNQASTGDTGIRWSLGTTTSFMAGIDNSDADKWKLSYAASGTAVLGTGDYLTVDTAGLFGVGTASPAVLLDVAGGEALRATTNANITANQNNYAIGAGTTFRLTSDATRDITGLTGGVDGKLLIILNVGANRIRLTNQDAASTAANRIITGTGGTVNIDADDTAMLIYDSTTARWRQIA